LSTKIGYRFHYPACFEGNYQAGNFLATLFNVGTPLAQNSLYADGDLYAMFFNNLCNLDAYHCGIAWPVNLTVQHTSQADGTNPITTTAWGFNGLSYDICQVRCKNVADAYTIPYILYDAGVAPATNMHTAEVLGFLSATHLTSNITQKGGCLRLTGVNDLKILITTGSYLLNLATENTYFNYLFTEGNQPRKVSGLSAWRAYVASVTTGAGINIDLPAPTYGYGYFGVGNISGQSASVYIRRMAYRHYDGGLMDNVAASDIMAPSTVGGGAGYGVAAAQVSPAAWRIHQNGVSGTATIIWDITIQHDYA